MRPSSDAPADLEVQRQETLGEAEIAVRYRFGGALTLELSYRCDACSGYGSPCRHCSDGRNYEKHTFASLVKRIGLAAVEEFLTKFLDARLAG